MDVRHEVRRDACRFRRVQSGNIARRNRAFTARVPALLRTIARCPAAARDTLSTMARALLIASGRFAEMRIRIERYHLETGAMR
jgi:hypothetical protein